MKTGVLISVLLFFISLYHASGQSVGLVLSGGGAKGIAHIGLIRALEENNIPIDYVTGTSIGAIIGGMYAAGFSPDEMKALFKSDDFYFWSTGRVQEKYRYFFKKGEPDPSWIDLRFTKKEEKIKILPPTNIISQVQMDFAFMELMSATNAACKYNFDSLMVPFRCVASDMYNNRAVVLKSGDLGDAIRASMTVPLYFKPIQIDDVLLFDGGILNNFPQDVMRETFKPEIIIGHKVAGDIKPAATDDLIEQISNVAMRQSNYEIDKNEGLLIESKLPGVSLLSFDKYDLIEEIGYRTALKYIDSLKVLISRRVTPEEIKEKRAAFNSRKPKLVFENIQVEGVRDPLVRKFIIQSFKHNRKTITLQELKDDYFKLIADEHLKSIRPISNFDKETGRFDLHLIVEPEKKVKVTVGGNISTKPINQGFASFDFRTYNQRAYTFSSNIYFGRFYSSFKFGGRIDFPTKRPYYIMAYSTLNRWDYFSSSSELFFEDVRPPYIIQNEYNFRVESGMPLGLHNKLFAGIAFSNTSDEYYQIARFNKSDTPDNTTFSGFVNQIGFERNTLNYRQFSTEGIYNFISFKNITGVETNEPGSTSAGKFERSNNHNYLLFEVHSEKYFRIKRRFAIGTLSELVLSNKDEFLNYRSTILSAPAFTPTPHSKSLYAENFRANNYLAGGLRGIYNINSSLHFRLEGYGFVPFHEIKQGNKMEAVKNEKLISSVHFQALSALVMQTGIGPLSLMVSYYDKPDTKFYFTLNFGYILFNHKGF